MSVTAAELLFFGALNGATSQGPVSDDVAAIGGDIDVAWCPSFTQIARPQDATAKVQVASSGTGDGTKKVVVVGRDFAGAQTSEVISISATANLLTLGTVQWQRISQCYVTANDGVTKTVPAGVITVKDNAGAPNTLGTIGGAGLGSQYGFYMLFESAVSDPLNPKVRYEIIYVKNTDATLALLNSTVTLTADASGKLTIALANALGSIGAAGGNRVTAPSGISLFSGVGAAINVPNTQKLTAGSYLAIVVKQTLAAAAAAQSNVYSIQLAGNTI